MKLILKEQQKQERKKLLDASAYKECIVEYKDRNGDIQKMLLVMDEIFENIIVFWHSAVFVYSMSNDLLLEGDDDLLLEEVYEEIEHDLDVDVLISIDSVSTTVSYELEKK